MNKKTISFLYNVRRVYPDPNNKKSLLQVDFDDPSTIDWMIKHFGNLGFQIVPIEADEKAYFKLYKNRKSIKLAFNYSEGIYGLDREAQIPAMLEMLQIPYTGSSPLTQALVLNKAKTKEVLKFYGVSVLPHQVVDSANFVLNNDLAFPLIVKPIAEGSSAGISNESVVNNLSKLKTQVKKVIDIFQEPALIEPFLTGREFSVSMLGNPPEILPIIESDHSVLPKKYLPLDSLEVKWYFEEESEKNNLICPPKISRRLEKRIKDICFRVWQALNVKDFCRIDIRCDENETPYVLEINSPAGLIPPEVSKTSYFPLAARVSGIDYENLLLKIISSACKRYNIDLLS